MGELSEALIDLNKERVLSAVRAGIADGQDPLQLVDEARQGMEEIGRKFERGDLYLMELMRAAQIFKSAAEVLTPAIKQRHGSLEAKGRVLIGTVAGDIHDLGKNIVASLLECRGYQVVDLGVDVKPAAFVDKIKEVHPDVVGLSALLTASIPQMRTTIEAIESAGLRAGRKVIVGGGIVGEVDRSTVKADHATTDANEGVRVMHEWMKARA